MNQTSEWTAWHQSVAPPHWGRRGRFSSSSRTVYWGPSCKWLSSDRRLWPEGKTRSRINKGISQEPQSHKYKHANQIQSAVFKEPKSWRSPKYITQRKLCSKNPNTKTTNNRKISACKTFFFSIFVYLCKFLESAYIRIHQLLFEC